VSRGVKTSEVSLAGRLALARKGAAIDGPAAAALLATWLLLVALVARALLALHVAAPWIMKDELGYAETSRNFLSGTDYLFQAPLGLHTTYPALVSPAWLAGSTTTAYTLVKVINVGLMTLGAIPLYLWARRLVAPMWAVLSVVLYLAMPGFIYSSEIVTENAFLPAMMLALLALALALERPTLRRQLLALGAIALATAVRAQGVVFLAVLPTAVALVLLLDAIAAAPGTRRSAVVDKLRRFWPSLGAVVLAVVAYVVYEAARGGSLSQGLGDYQSVVSAHYALRPVLRFSAYHFGELAFSVGLIPVSALIVLFGLACRRATAPGAAERAFLALTTAAIVWFVLEAAAFAAQFPPHRIEERYMFYLDAPLFLALVVWLARGLPRPSRLGAVAVLAPAVLLLALPYDTFFTEALPNDTFGLIPLSRLTMRLGANAGDVPVLVGAGALVAGLLFAVVPRSWGRVVVPVAVGGFLAASSASVFAEVSFLANATRHAGGLTGDPNWIDRAVGNHARVEMLWTPDITDPHVIWQMEFWNRSVRNVFDLPAGDPGQVGGPASIDDRSGFVRPSLPPGSPDLHAHLFVTANDVDVAGTPIAAAGQLMLWRTAGPLQLRSSVTGMTQDGWTGATAGYTVYVAPPGTRHVVLNLAQVQLAGLPTARVRVSVGPAGTTTAWEQRTVTMPSGGVRHLRLPVRHAPFQMAVSVSPTFSPSQFGLADTRTLGVRASFSLSH
jgi:hypothetical protein